MGFSALGSNRRGGPEACGTRVFVRLSGGDATHIRRRQSHFSHGQATGSPHGQLKAEAVRPTLRARQVSDDMTGGLRAGIRGNQTPVGNLDERRSDLCARLLHSMSLPASLITDEAP